MDLLNGEKDETLLSQITDQTVLVMVNSTMHLASPSVQTMNLYVCDLNNHRIQVLDRNGSFVRKFGS